MSIFTVVMLCFTAFVIGVHISTYAFVPDKYPINWFELGGWVLYAVAIIAWEIGSK